MDFSLVVHKYLDSDGSGTQADCVTVCNSLVRNPLCSLSVQYRITLTFSRRLWPSFNQMATVRQFLAKLAVGTLHLVRQST